MDEITLLQRQGSVLEKQTSHNPTQNKTQPPTQVKSCPASVKPYGGHPCMIYASDLLVSLL